MNAQQQVEHHEAEARAAWNRMQEARAAGNRRAENRAWRENQQHRDAAARWRAQANRWDVSSNGFNG